MSHPTAVDPIAWRHLFARRAGRMQASEIREFLKLLGSPDMISFAGGIPDPELFPVDGIQRAFAAIMGDPRRAAEALQYAVSEGYAPLRAWIAGYMTDRGMPCEPDHILITTGSQQALDLLGKVFLDPGDVVLTTAPAYLGALQALEVYEPAWATIDLESGAIAGPPSPALAYLVPDFGNPTGLTVALEDRHRFLERARALRIPVIEDAAYEALRFEGKAVPSLLALELERTGHIDRSRVIYTGTFSKTIAPGLRVGWVCAAREVIGKLVLARQAADLHGSMLDQMLVYEVAAAGFGTQVDRIIPVYRHRRDVMLRSLEQSMPPGVSWTHPEGGMFTWLTLPEGLDSRDLLRESIASERIVFVPGTSFSTDGGGARHIRLNYTRSSDAVIEDGIQRLGALFARRLAAAGARHEAPVPIAAGTP